MTRRFRLGLFVCLAAAVGLHVRPCVLTLIRGGSPGAADCYFGETVVELAAHTDLAFSGGVQAASRAALRPPLRPSLRPSLASMMDAPAMVGTQTAAAGDR